MKIILLNFISVIYKVFSYFILMLKGLKKSEFKDLFIISVDNLSFGGTGKTPAVLEIGKLLGNSGVKFAVVLRGYKGSLSKGSHLVNNKHSFCEVGDEAVIYKRRLTSADIFIGKNRKESITKAADRGNSVIILDDGFQSQHIKKDFKIMLINPAQPYYYYRHFKFLKKMSDIIYYLGTGKEVEKRVESERRKIKEGKYSFEIIGFFDKDEKEKDPGNEKAVAFSAVGDNARFKNDLTDLNVVKFFHFADHYALNENEIREIEDFRISNSCKYTICTEKDFIKLDPEISHSLPLIYIKNRIKSFPDAGKLVLAQLDEKKNKVQN